MWLCVLYYIIIFQRKTTKREHNIEFSHDENPIEALEDSWKPFSTRLSVCLQLSKIRPTEKILSQNNMFELVIAILANWHIYISFVPKQYIRTGYSNPRQLTHLHKFF